jgi:hypothetical protein
MNVLDPSDSHCDKFKSFIEERLHVLEPCDIQGIVPLAHKGFHFYLFFGSILLHTTPVFVFYFFVASTDYWVAVITFLTKKTIDVFYESLRQHQVVKFS